MLQRSKIFIAKFNLTQSKAPAERHNLDSYMSLRWSFFPIVFIFL